MKTRQLFREHAVVRLYNPLIDWLYGAVGALLIVALLALGAYLDDVRLGLPDETAHAAHARGLQEGRAEQRASYVLSLRAAYQGGLDEGMARCTTSEARR